MGAAGHVLTRFDRARGKPATPGLSKALPLFSFGERDPGIAAAAVSIFGWRRGEIALRGALAGSVPSAVSPELVSRIQISLLDEGRELSAQLGGPTRRPASPRERNRIREAIPLRRIGEGSR
jgi:hypothetical protein